MVSVREGLAGRKLSFLLLFHIFIVILNLFYYYHFIFYLIIKCGGRKIGEIIEGSPTLDCIGWVKALIR